ncbi:uncharacterized protein LOC110976467 [Acanthaster planci]|uniref:Uncharacterized protein LOC110976467 n=1 Tax=Acanthaster planci TaxID=133434 RepID=A0A8B7Y0B5_ACAPL|nr:uncharacterized protein LOC110976467 [Acanthaster planci]
MTARYQPPTAQLLLPDRDPFIHCLVSDDWLIPVLHLSPLHPSPVVPSSPIRHGHRRQLLFSDVVDDFTQLSKQYIRNNMATSSDLCHTFDEVLPAVPIQKAKELLELPGRTAIFVQ